MVPNSQRAVFASNGFSFYWRKVQKSFSDFVSLGMIGRTLELDVFSTPSYNKRLALLTAGVVSATISSKTGFMEWYTTRGGWVSYTNDFPASWPGCDLIVGSSFGVPI